MIVWSALSFSASLNSFFLVPIPLCRLGFHSSVRWRLAWLSCTCGPPRAHSKSKVARINVNNLLLSHQLSLWLSLSPLTLFSHPLSTLALSSFTIRLSVSATSLSTWKLYILILTYVNESLTVKYIHLSLSCSLRHTYSLISEEGFHCLDKIKVRNSIIHFWSVMFIDL